MRGLGGWGSLSGSGPRTAFNDDYGGMLIGAGIGRGGFTAGLGGGFLATSLHFSDGSGASQNAGLGFVYGRYTQGPMWFGAMAAYGGGKMDGTRMLPGTGLAATGNRGADFGIVQARAAYDLPLGTITLEPRATLAYIHAGQAGFSETGASLLDLTYAGTNTDVAEGRLALRVMQSFSTGGWTLLPWVEAGVQETFAGLSRGVVASDGAFSAGVSGVSPAPSSAVLGIGVTASAAASWDVFAAYQGLFSANQTGNAFSAGFAYRF
jgi:outer membrane autotransporter protein